MLNYLENLMFQLSDLFMAPVLIIIALLFCYSLYELGGFAFQAWQRRNQRSSFRQIVSADRNAVAKAVTGYPIASLYLANPSISKDELDVAAFENIEGVRIVSRLAPMLGLIATMIPMGPALKSLADGNIQGISENLIVAFSAVIFGLVIASITFWIASVKKRWLAGELMAVAKYQQHNAQGEKQGGLREAA